MQYHQGRLIDHVNLHVADLERSRAFYLAILQALGKAGSLDGNDRNFWCDELYVDARAAPSTNVHLAFQAGSIEAVQAFHRAGLAAGGRDNGAPGYRRYFETYYAAYLLDPDSNNIEAVCDVGASRSSESVVVERK